MGFESVCENVERVAESEPAIFEEVRNANGGN